MERRLFRKAALCGFVVGLLALTGGSCGSSSTPAPAPPGIGSVFTLIQDAPACDLLEYHLQTPTMQVRLKGSISGNLVNVFSTSSANFLAPNFNLPSLSDSETVLALSSIREGTFDQATIFATVTAAAIFDPTQTPPFSLFPVRQNGNFTVVNIIPPLVITKGKVSVLRLDYNLAKSVQTDSQGQLTGEITPTIGLTPLTATSANGYGEMDDMEGFVRSVSPSATGADFIGSFLLQEFGQTGPAVSVDLTASTQLLGAPGLNQLLTASFVEVQAHVDTQGNLVADIIRVEDQEDLSKNEVAYLGPVLSVTRDASGNVRSFTMLVGETEPSVNTAIPVDTAVNFMVSATTTYDFSFPSMNFASLSLDPSAIAPGEELAVNGPYTKIAGQTTSVAVNSIYVRPQTVQGNFVTLVQAGSDDKTGAFQFTACGGVFQQVPIWVFSNNQTNFVNVSGLSALSTFRALLIRGVAFYQQQAATISGVQVPAGSLVILASQVDQH